MRTSMFSSLQLSLFIKQQLFFTNCGFSHLAPASPDRIGCQHEVIVVYPDDGRVRSAVTHEAHAILVNGADRVHRLLGKDLIHELVRLRRIAQEMYTDDN